MGLLELPREESFKHDDRSEVWRVRDGEQVWVIKRMRSGGAWLRLMWMLGHHPIRREWRAVRRLERLGVAVVKPAWVGRIANQAVLITPHAGTSLHHVLRLDDCDRSERLAIAHQLGDILHIFLQHAIAFKDMKVSNIMVDRVTESTPRVRLIDVESARRAIFFRHGRLVRMLALLDHSAAVKRPPSRTERWRVMRRAFRGVTDRATVRRWVAAIGLSRASWR